MNDNNITQVECPRCFGNHSGKDCPLKPSSVSPPVQDVKRECDCDSCKQGEKDLAEGNLVSSFATVWKRDGIAEVRLNNHMIVYTAIDGNTCVDDVAAAINKEHVLASDYTSLSEELKRANALYLLAGKLWKLAIVPAWEMVKPRPGGKLWAFTQTFRGE